MKGAEVRRGRRSVVAVGIVELVAVLLLVPLLGHLADVENTRGRLAAGELEVVAGTLDGELSERTNRSPATWSWEVDPDDGGEPLAFDPTPTVYDGRDEFEPRQGEPLEARVHDGAVVQVVFDDGAEFLDSTYQDRRRVSVVLGIAWALALALAGPTLLLGGRRGSRIRWTAAAVLGAGALVVAGFWSGPIVPILGSAPIVVGVLAWLAGRGAGQVVRGEREPFWWRHKILTSLLLIPALWAWFAVVGLSGEAGLLTDAVMGGLIAVPLLVVPFLWAMLLFITWSKVRRHRTTRDGASARR